MIKKRLQLVLQSLIFLMTAVTCVDLRAEVNSAALDPANVIGIEAIVAAASDGAVYSRFGHAMLRFVKADGDFTTDLVVSLEADVGSAKIDALKGLDGGYKTVPTIDSFGDFWVKYVMTEERPLQRFIIPSTPEMRATLLSTLQSWIKNPALAGNYTFLNNNCVGALASLLEKSGFPRTIGMNPIIPTHLDGWLQHSFLSFYPGLEMQSPKLLYQRAARLLGITPEDFIAGRNWPSNAADTINGDFSDLEIKRLLLQLKNLPYQVRMALVPSHRFNNGGASLEQAMSYQTVPNSLYQVCATASCMRDVVNSMNQLWSAPLIRKSVSSARFVYSLVSRGENDNDPVMQLADSGPELFNEDLSIFPENISKIPALIIHAQLFLREELGISR